MKRFFRIFFILLAIILGASSCGKLKDIKFTSYRIVSVAPTSLKSMDLTMDLGISNPSMELGLSDMKAKVYRHGHQLGTVTLEPVTILSKCEKEYTAKAHIALEPGVSALQVMAYGADFDPAEYTLDIVGKVKLKSGLSKKIQLKNKPLTKFMKEKK